MTPKAALGSPGLSTILGILLLRRRWILVGALLSATVGILIRLVLPSNWEASATLVSVAPPIPDSYASVMRLVRGKVVPLSPDLELFRSILNSSLLRDSVFQHPTTGGTIGNLLGSKSSADLADHWKLTPVNEPSGGMFELRCRAHDSALARELCRVLPAIALDRWQVARQAGLEAETSTQTLTNAQLQRQYDLASRRQARWLENNRTAIDPQTRMHQARLELEVGAIQAGFQRSLTEAARLEGEANARSMPLIAVGSLDVGDEPIDPPLWRIAVLTALLGGMFAAITTLIAPLPSEGRSVGDLAESAATARPLDGHDRDSSR